jgi:hypothetical protein
VTIFLILSYNLLLFSDLGLFVIPATFGFFGFVITLISVTRAIYPQVRNYKAYKTLMLFDVTALAQIVRKKMNEVKGKGRRYRQEAIVYGTGLFPFSAFIIALSFEDKTNAFYFIFAIACFMLAISILLIGYGVYGYDKCRRWLGIEDKT